MEFFDYLSLKRLRDDVDRLKKNVGMHNPFAAKQSDIEQLQVDVGELRLHVAVIFRLLLSKGIVTAQELEHAWAEIDAADGADGQFFGNPMTGEIPPPPPAPDLPTIQV